LLSIPGTEALSGPVKYLIAFTVIFALLALLAVVLRRLTGGRLAMPAQERGRTRQPRLGIVDVYDLDRQRQLILLRRDNVEHLLLIGGPNDVIVETNIVRMGGARLPATPIEPSFERADALVDRSFETPARPLVEPPRAEPVVARLGPADATRANPDGHLHDEPGPLAVEPVLKPDVVALSPTSAPRPTPPPVREAVPVKPAQRVAPARVAQQPPEPPAPSRPAPEPPARQIAAHAAARGGEQSSGDAAVLSDMARQLEDALKRPLAPTKGVVNAGRPPNGPAPQIEEPYQRRPQPSPKVSSPPAAPPPVAPAPVPSPRPVETYDAQPRPRPTTVTRIRAAAEPEAPKPAPPAPEPAAPPRAVAASQEQVDPFSVEEIEAEFARLLGRPLDRGDRANQ
jgi:flagellar protein FliO/FliZ